MTIYRGKSCLNASECLKNQSGIVWTSWVGTVDERKGRLWIWSCDGQENHPLKGIRDGFIAVKAPNEQGAWELLKKEDLLYWWHLQGRPTLPISATQPTDIKELKKWIETEIAPYVTKRCKDAYKPTYLREYRAFVIRPVFGNIEKL